MTSSEVVIAVIGLLGVALTAVFGNWDKLFPKPNIVKAEFSRQPTENFATELRYYFDVSGVRDGFESLMQQMLLNSKLAQLSSDPDHAKQTEDIFEAIEKERPQLDDVIRALMPVYQKHFTLAELQELNKFYSTDVMQRMISKLPLLAPDAARMQERMQREFIERLSARLQGSVAAD